MNYSSDKLEKADGLVYEILKNERLRQQNKLLLNAATSFTPQSIMEIQGSVFDNIDAEGYIPGYLKSQSIQELSDIDKQMSLYETYKDDRFNKCCEYANILEALAQKRLAKVFTHTNAAAENININVQVPTGALANEIVYRALVNRGGTILSLGVNDGGHTTHGDEEHISYDDYNILHYHVDLSTGEFKWDEIEELLKTRTPALMIAGASSYPLEIDWIRIKELISRVSPSTLLLADIAHTAGLVAGKVFNNPVGIADVTTMVAYKTFCGPRAAAIITTNDKLAKKIDQMVFPKIMGSPLFLGVAGLAVAAEIALTDEYKKMQERIVDNARLLCAELMKNGLNIAYDKTDTHIVLLDCFGYANGREMADILEDCGILVNSVTIPAQNGYHQGIRIGTTAITQCNVSETEIKEIAELIAIVFRCVKLGESIDYSGLKKRVGDLMKGRN